MDRPNIEEITKRLKRGTGYRSMQETALSLIGWIHEIELDNKEVVEDYMSMGKEFGETLEEVDNALENNRYLWELVDGLACTRTGRKTSMNIHRVVHYFFGRTE